MDNTFYIVLQNQNSLQKKLDIVSNNVANMNTIGFQRKGIIFNDVKYQLSTFNNHINMGKINNTYVDQSFGSIQSTGNKLDMAINGKGYFKINKDNQTFFTRNGNFKMNLQGELTTNTGETVLDQNDSPIVIPSDSTQIFISRNGTISNQNGFITKIGVVDQNYKNLTNVGDNLFTSTEEGEPIESEVLQGFLENSNVNSVSELTQMIEIQRAYESGVNLLQQENERLKSVIDTLKR